MSVKSAILNTLMVATLLSFPLQCLIDPSVENVASVCIVLTSSMIALGYIKWGGAADAQPVSTLAILGFSITTQLGALLVMTGFWQPLRATLYTPISTFATLAFYQLVGIFVHVAYRYLVNHEGSDRGLFRGILRWANIYAVPASQSLWFMGVIGLLSFVGARNAGIVGKICTGLNFLTWAPFLLPIYARAIGPHYCNIRLNQIFLGVFTLAVALLGIAFNARSIMFIGVVTVVLLYLLIGLRTYTPVTRRALMQMALVGAVVGALASPLSDLATAMAIARGARGKISSVEMLTRTIDVWRRPALMAEYRAERDASARYAVYDERYIPNALLARFVETKFHDNALHFADTLKSEDSKQRMWQYTVDTTLALLPAPVLHLLHISINKEDINYSMCDYLVYLSRGGELGGRKTGSLFAQGNLVLGPLFPILYGFLCLVIFGMLDLLTIRVAGAASNPTPLAMMSTWVFFFRGITSDAVSNLFVFISREFFQIVFIYALVYGIARAIFGPNRAEPMTNHSQEDLSVVIAR